MKRLFFIDENPRKRGGGVAKEQNSGESVRDGDSGRTATGAGPWPHSTSPFIMDGYCFFSSTKITNRNVSYLFSSAVFITGGGSAW